MSVISDDLSDDHSSVSNTAVSGTMMAVSDHVGESNMPDPSPDYVNELPWAAIEDVETVEYFDIGDMDQICQHCFAKYFEA
ncbi:hypothetical protein BGW41_000222, partial [Actinomortierella wolfii]